MDLSTLRESIDEINEIIAEDIRERMDLVEKIGRIKESKEISIEDSQREEEVRQQFRRLFREREMDPERGEELANLLIEMAKDRQR